MDLKFCEERLNMWLKAEEMIAVGGQQYEIQGRKLTRADLQEVRNQIEYWSKKISTYKTGGIKFERASLG